MLIKFKAACAALLLLIVTACGEPLKGDLIEKARGIETRSALQQALGKPNEISKLGPVEQWIDKAKDGEVTFVIAGDTVALQVTGSR